MHERQGELKEFFSKMTRSLALITILASGVTLSAVAQMPATPGLSSTAAAAPAVAPAGPAKIAVVAFQLAVAQTNEGQRDFAELQKKYAPKEAGLKAQSDEIDNLTKQLQTQGASLSEAERNNRAKTIDEKKKQLDRETSDLRDSGQQDMQDMYNSLASKVYDVMQSYAEQQGYTLILDISQQQSPVLFASEGTNITKAVIDAYNTKSGVPAPAAQTGADAPKPKPTTPATKPSTAAPKTTQPH
jgi:outer membrane protein